MKNWGAIVYIVLLCLAIVLTLFEAVLMLLRLLGRLP